MKEIPMIFLWTILAIYLVGFGAIFALNIAMGPVTLGLSLLRAIVWPLWVLTGIPHGVQF
jgi:hypothetical protein